MISVMIRRRCTKAVDVDFPARIIRVLVVVAAAGIVRLVGLFLSDEQRIGSPVEDILKRGSCPIFSTCYTVVAIAVGTSVGGIVDPGMTRPTVSLGTAAAGAVIQFDGGFVDLVIVRVVVQVVLLDVWKDLVRPTPLRPIGMFAGAAWVAVWGVDSTMRKLLQDVMMIVECQAELFEVIHAFGSAS